MKKYEKPRLTALSLGTNDMLCGSCANRGASILVKDNIDVFEPLASLFGNYDDKLERSDFNNIFAATEQCSETLDFLEAYCKFTSADVIFWS